MDSQQLKFDNSFVRTFPGDTGPADRSRMTPRVLYSSVHPTRVRDPQVLAWSAECAHLLDLPAHAPDWAAEVFAGNKLLVGMQPYSARYGGHQFGHWAGQLGDGRAITLGELINMRGERWEIQLKGAGRTPYSRHADGRAVLRSSMREFLCSEAMHHLGIPTTRALCCVGTGEQVIRDMFYDGHPEPEPGAITTRVAPTFLRFGNFQILAAFEETDLLRSLAEYTVATYFPGHNISTAEGVGTWLREISARTAKLMVEWLRVGFVHGVMNTDNMSILGLTIDYGPYGWLDVYDPEWTPNTTDADMRRYRFGAQPEIALWNLHRLAEALAPLYADSKPLEEALDHYGEVFHREFTRMMANKFGLERLRDEDDLNLVQACDRALRATETDMTLFYRGLAALVGLGDVTPETLAQTLAPALYPETRNADGERELVEFCARYHARMLQEQRPVEDIRALMNQTNPCVVPRNYQVQMALDEFMDHGTTTGFERLLQAVRTPYFESEHTRPYMQRRPEWARHRAGCSALSCSS